MNFHLDPAGPQAWLVRNAEGDDDEAFLAARRWLRALERLPPPGLVETVPGFTAHLLEFHDRAPGAEALADRLRRAWDATRDDPPPEGALLEIPVVYGGPDLARVAAHHGLTPAEVARRHAEPAYSVRLLGFAPGFAYLHGLPASLRTPRLPSPRPRVPAGSVAIGGSHTAVYPLETPGGWNLIGRTAASLFDPSRPGAQAFRLRPGDRVRFVPRGSLP